MEFSLVYLGETNRDGPSIVDICFNFRISNGDFVEHFQSVHIAFCSNLPNLFYFCAEFYTYTVIQSQFSLDLGECFFICFVLFSNLE